MSSIEPKFLRILLLRRVMDTLNQPPLENNQLTVSERKDYAVQASALADELFGNHKGRQAVERLAIQLRTLSISDGLQMLRGTSDAWRKSEDIRLADEKREQQVKLQKQARKTAQADAFWILPANSCGVDYGAPFKVLLVEGANVLAWQTGHMHWTGRFSPQEYSATTLTMAKLDMVKRASRGTIHFIYDTKQELHEGGKLSVALITRFRKKLAERFSGPAIDALLDNKLKSTVFFNATVPPVKPDELILSGDQFRVPKAVVIQDTK